MKICWITLCRNEMDILPFVRQYWERVASKVIVYDNGSDDGSIEYLESLPYVEIRHFDSNGQNDIIQKQVKENAYLEFRNQFDVIIITDMDEVFYFGDLKADIDKMLNDGLNAIVTPLYSLCEDYKPTPTKDKLLHQLCHKFYKQKMNHMKGFEELSKISIFNCKATEEVRMSVGQHYVQTTPEMKLLLSNNAFGLHIDKGFSKKYFVQKCQKMGANLSTINKMTGMAVEYLDSVEELEKKYDEKQTKSFDLNEII